MSLLYFRDLIEIQKVKASYSVLGFSYLITTNRNVHMVM